MYFGKKNLTSKLLKMNKLIFNAKQLEINKIIKSISQFIISTSNTTLEIPSLCPCNKLLILCFRFSKIFDESLPQSQMVLSSAKLQISINVNISLIKALNNRAPKIDHCGTPLLISFHKLYN